MIIHVRNFGKIESADIDLSNLVIFVGENNSGKTYLMQLIYGLFSFFYSREFSAFSPSFNILDIDNKLTEIKSDDNAFYKTFQDELNSFILQNKDNIVASTFHTHNLTIGSLSVEFKTIPYDFLLKYEGEYERSGKVFEGYSICKSDEKISNIGFGRNFPKDDLIRIIKSELMFTILSDLTGLTFKRNSIQDTKPFIYLPASRSGIMLLYANYLS
ncbi:MAG: ATP-binding protein, partial [Ruminiclostridium sp.]|nr:ATP-binding protein [Ruminiclostridium sp.]